MWNKNPAIYWWSPILLKRGNYENFGDLISKFLFEQISNKKTDWVNIQRRNILNRTRKVFTVTGSILGHIDKNCIVWGNGIMFENESIAPAKFYALRGPSSLKVVKMQHKIGNVVLGDPGLLLSAFYSNEKSQIRFKYGVFPNHIEYQFINNLNFDSEDFLVINPSECIHKVIDKILSCEMIITSSLHGLVTSHSYAKPAVWIKFTDMILGGNTKFNDYFLNFYNVPPVPYQYKNINIFQKDASRFYKNKSHYLINDESINKIQDNLLSAFPHNEL